jgi:hypothetical protein
MKRVGREKGNRSAAFLPNNATRFTALFGTKGH